MTRQPSSSESGATRTAEGFAQEEPRTVLARLHAHGGLPVCGKCGEVLSPIIEAEAAAPAGLDVDDWRLLEWARSTVLSLIETAPVVARSKLFNAARSSGYDLDRAIKRRLLQGTEK